MASRAGERFGFGKSNTLPNLKENELAHPESSYPLIVPGLGSGGVLAALDVSF